MTSRLLCVLAFAVLLNACGVKNDLEVPNAQQTIQDERDPSRPPQPLGQ
jgi:predicted small lipoprotein YifL